MLCVCVCVCVFLGSICLTFFLLRDFFFHLFCILLLSCHPLHLVSLHSCTYTDFFVSPWSSLIIFMFFRWSFPASCTLCQSWQKEGEIVENMWFLSKILHVGEMCFILLGGVLTSFFLYTGLMTMFTYIALIFDIYMMMYVFFTYLYMCCFFSIFIHMFLVLVYNLFISVSHIDALMSFV